MVNKEMRTKKRYAQAEAELDILEACLDASIYAKDMLPAKDIDYLINVRYRIRTMIAHLESKASSDYFGEPKFISEKESNEDYKKRYDEIVSVISCKKQDRGGN